MALPELVKKRVEGKLKKYCEEKVPERVRDRVRVEFKIRGDNVTLLERRPAFMNPDIWVSIPVAQFRYNPDNKKWYLYWCDRNSRWHFYFDLEPTANLDALIREVEEDPTGIFWG
jgi:hypothetical protein